MVCDLELIVKVQGMDLRAAELRKEIAQLPRHIQDIERTLESHTRKLQADKAVVSSNQNERKQLDGEIQVQRQKMSKLRDQMQTAKTNEVFRAFQHEIEFCEKEIRKHEDRVLELMVEAESFEYNVQAAEISLQQEKERVEQEKIEARERVAADQKALEAVMAERQQAVAEIAPNIYANYARIGKRTSMPVSDATLGRCSACQMELRPQLFQELRRGDKLILCESCGRILHYNPPVTFDEVAGAPATAAGATRVDMT